LILKTANDNAHIIWGSIIDEDLKDEMIVTIVSAGFKVIEAAAPIIQNKHRIDLKTEKNCDTEDLFPFFQTKINTYN